MLHILHINFYLEKELLLRSLFRLFHRNIPNFQVAINNVYFRGSTYGGNVVTLLSLFDQVMKFQDLKEDNIYRMEPGSTIDSIRELFLMVIIYAIYGLFLSDIE